MPEHPETQTTDCPYACCTSGNECDEPLPCKHCEGTGEVFVKRNSRGQVDYLDGSPTNERTRCDMCHGEGVEQ